MKYILQVFKNNYKLILLVYLICSISSFLYILEPYIIGKMIDGLLNDNYIPMFYFILLQSVFIIIGLIRRIWDTKIFTKIQNNIILTFILTKKDNNESILNARIEMIKDVINFLENEIPSYLASAFTIIGSLFFIFEINLYIGIILLLYLIPSILFFRYYYKKNKKIIKLINSNDEEQVKKIKTKNINIITYYFNRKRQLKIFESTLNGKNWAIFDILMNIFLLISLIIYVKLGNMTIGEVVAFYGYVKYYLASTLIFSFAMSTYARLIDISKRIV